MLSLKVNIIDVHLDELTKNMRKYSEEQGVHFHQDMLDCHNQEANNVTEDYI